MAKIASLVRLLVVAVVVVAGAIAAASSPAASHPASGRPGSFMRQQHAVRSGEYPPSGVTVWNTTQCASAAFTNNVNVTGWGELTVTANPACTAEKAAYDMGYLEGQLTQRLIWDAFVNFNASNHYLESGHLPSNIQAFVDQQLAWLSQQVAAEAQASPYWRNAGLFLQQARGLQDGYIAAAPRAQQLTAEQVYVLTYAGDLEDVAPGISHINGSTMRTCHEQSHEEIRMDCSGFVRIAPGLNDLFVGHNTWNTYYAALRIFKHYVLNGTQFAGLDGVSADVISFSSRPGDLESKDDFYAMSSQLSSLETSLTVFNKSLYAALSPNTVPVWIRAQIANRMASSAPAWVDTFRNHSSGTHNSEWLVVNYNLFEPGADTLPPNTVWMVEEMVSYAHSADMTPKLMSDGYLASFNIPFFEDIFNISGYRKAGFNYTNDARYKIFKRDHVKAVDLISQCDLMNSNDYLHDPLSGGNPCNAISARCDLPGANGTDFKPYDFGAIDSKNINAQLLKQQTVAIIGGMPHANLPPFSFTGKWASIPHQGMPETFDFDWTTTTPVADPSIGPLQRFPHM